MARLCTFFALLLAVPFGARAQLPDLGFVAPGENVTAPTDVPPTERADPLSDQLRLRAASMNELEVAEAVAAMARVGLWKEVDETLARAATRKQDDATAAAMARRIGPNLLMKISQAEEVNQPAKNLVRMLAEKLTADNSSPARLQQAINDLDDPSVDKQLGAIRVLLSGGNASIVALVQAIVADDPPSDRDTMLRTMLRLGDGGVMALRQLATYGNESVRSNALLAISRIDRERFAADLVAAFHAANATDEERQAAAVAFRKMALSVPSRNEAIEYLVDDLRRARELVDLTAGDDEIATVWSVSSDGENITSTETYVSIAAKHAAANSATRLRRLGELPQPMIIDALISDLSYRVTVDPLWGGEKQTQPIRELYGDVTVFSAAFSTALAREDWAAMIGIVQLVGDDNVANAEQWLAGEGGQPSALVQAALSPIPRVRFEATAAIARLQPDSSYPGSSQVSKTIAEMSRLRERPVAILVETIPELLSRQESFLSSMGFHVEIVTSVAELERQIEMGGDLRLILSKTALADARPIEMVDRVRRLPRGKMLPIIFYGEEANVLGATEFDVPTVQIPQPKSVTPIVQLVQKWSGRASLPPLVQGERNVFQSIGRDALGSR